jgi:predicted MFS family arabinose efflux permease
MAVVMFRSYVGQDFSSAIAKTPTLMLFIGGVAMLGKMAGGWLAKGFGSIPSMVVVLLVILIAMLFRQSGLAVLLVGIFAINCTMAVTLWLANVVLKGREGLAFGLLAAALIPGWLLAIY